MNSDCKLFRGDCLDVLKDVKSGSVDMVLADLPYGTTACKWDNVIPFEPLWAELHRVTKVRAPMVMFGSEPFSSRLRTSNLKRFKYDWIWKKIGKATGHLNAKKQPLLDFEVVSVFYGPQCLYSPVMRTGTPYKNKTGSDHSSSSSMTDSYGSYTNFRNENVGFRFPTRVIEFKREERGTVHPTQKPVALLEYLIKTYTNEGDTVLDPTMGSGSTGVACKNLNRNFIGIEMDEKYFAIAKRRIGSCNLQAEFK